MKNIIAQILTLALCFPALSNPLKIDDNKVYRSPPKIEGFKYWYGQVRSGEIIYLGEKFIAGFETELQLRFSKNKIVKRLLILGPAGIDEGNCIKKYKQVIAVLNEKYGHYKYQKTIKDPLADDLVTSSICVKIRHGLFDIVTKWTPGGYTIISTIIGDSDGYVIEIEYARRFPSNKKNLKKIL